jgi:hypothetical protein
MSVPSHQTTPETRQTFRSDGTQFTYPISYTLYTGAGQVPTDTCQSAVACVVYPRDRCTGTNFLAASFEERVIDDATTRGACFTSPMRALNYPEFRVAKDLRTINGVRFAMDSTRPIAQSNKAPSDGQGRTASCDSTLPVPLVRPIQARGYTISTIMQAERLEITRARATFQNADAVLSLHVDDCVYGVRR